VFSIFPQKNKEHRKNSGLFKYGRFWGRALPPRLKKRQVGLSYMTKNSVGKGGFLSLSEVGFFFSLYIFIIYIFKFMTNMTKKYI
jgi:hypothetical protein